MIAGITVWAHQSPAVQQSITTTYRNKINNKKEVILCQNLYQNLLILYVKDSINTNNTTIENTYAKKDDIPSQYVINCEQTTSSTSDGGSNIYTFIIMMDLLHH